MIPTEFSIENEVAIITGGGRGIGKAIALTLAEAGVDVTVVARTREQIEQTANEARQLGRRALAITADVSQENQVKEVVERTLSEFSKIDILVNNAGIGSGRKPVTYIPGIKFPGWELAGDNWNKPLSLEDWHRVMNTNLTSVFLFAQAVGPHMLSRRKGKIINISSNSADLGSPLSSVYCVSKAGLSSFTRCLASEWAPFGICVNAIAPGATRTEMMDKYRKNPEMEKMILEVIPEGRMAEPREIALLAVFLASQASNFINGETTYIDGGQRAHGPGKV